MHMKWMFVNILVLFTIVLTACGATTVAPTASNPGQPPLISNPTNSGADTGFATQTIEGGSVAVKVTPLKTQMDAPLEFEIVMDTHSVDLADDMVKVVVLRDAAGNEYAPLKWEGPAVGGHHRQGTVHFAPLSGKMKTLTLVIRNVAGVPERIYEWELAQ